MGQEIVYCAKCQIRLTSTDLQSGKAVKTADNVYCRACLPEGARKVPVPAPALTSSSTRMPLPNRPPTARRAATDAAPRRVLPWVLAAAGVAGAIGILVVLARPSTPPPEPVAARPIAAPSKPAPPPPPPPARADPPVDRRSDLQARVRQAQDKEEFRKAIDLIEEELRRPESAAAKGPLDRQLTEVRKKAESLFPGVKAQAVDAALRGAEEETRTLARRVEAWGLEDLRLDLDKSLESARKDAAARAGHFIYGDGIAPGWRDWGWGSTRDFANSAPAAEGAKSIAMTFTQKWAGLYLRSNKGIDPASFEALEFQAQATLPGQGLMITLWDEEKKVIGSVTVKNGDDMVPVGAWKRYRIPLEAFNASLRPIWGVAIQDATGVVPAIVYLDGISLLRRSR